MTLLSRSALEAAAGLTVIAGLAVGAVFLFGRKRPTDEEIERARRKFLAQTGRLVDGMLLDVREMQTDDGRTLTLLEYSYRNGGADYECSQDITSMTGVIDIAQMRAGFPCSVRYQQNCPQNSIVVAEEWSGLRSTLPVYPPVGLHAIKRQDPDLGHLRPGPG
jgi:hypothetical protein